MEPVWAEILFLAGMGGLVMAMWSSWGLPGWKQWVRWRVILWAGVMALGAGAVWSSDASDGWSGVAATQVFMLGVAPFVVGALVCAEPSNAEVNLRLNIRLAGAGREGPVSADRERVLGLLERGAITGDEAAELLAALGRGSAEGRGVSAQTRKWLLIGAGLVLVGFFLPWAKLNLGEEMAKMMPQLPWQLGNTAEGGTMPNMPGFMQMSVNGQPVPGTGAGAWGMQPSTGDMTIAAADLKHGLGWWILLLALAAAVLPQVQGLRRKTVAEERMILAALVGVGAILLLVVSEELFRFMQPGLGVTLAGYALLAVAVGREFRQAGGVGAAGTKAVAAG